jgi:hypothetical protein
MLNVVAPKRFAAQALDILIICDNIDPLWGLAMTYFLLF